jgi:hypothetical protein
VPRGTAVAKTCASRTRSKESSRLFVTFARATRRERDRRRRFGGDDINVAPAAWPDKIVAPVRQAN